MRKLVTSLLLLGMTTSMVAQQCDLPISIAFPKESGSMPVAVRRSLVNKLKQVLTMNGVGGDYYYEQFALIPRVEVSDQHILAGPPKKHVYNITLYLEIQNAVDKIVFAASSLELNGVGENETKAYMSAVRQIAPQAKPVKELISTGRQKILAYYDKNYPRIIQKAQQLARMNKYEEALYHIMSVPECCAGYQSAMTEAQIIFQQLQDRNGEQLLMKAKAIWAAGNNDKAAAEAASLLAQIDPSSSAYSAAGTLLADIKSKASEGVPWNYQLQVHNDAVALEQQRIEAAKAVGVAYGNGQRESNLILTK